MGKRQFKPGNMLYPVPAVLVTVADREGNSNIFTVAWAGTICTNPPMLSISVRPERHSYHMMKETGEFVVNLTTESMAWATDYCGVRSGRDVDKWKETGLTPEKANVVDVPVIKESPVNIECRVVKVEELGSHHMFLAQVVAVDVDEAYMDEKDTGFLLDLACYSIIEENNAGQYYPDYAYEHALFTPDMKIYTDSKVSDFLHGLKPEQSVGFLNSWNRSKNKRQKIYLSYDSTNKNCQAGDIDLVEYGNAKVDAGLPIFNYSVACDSANREPLFYELYPGSLNDVSQLICMTNKAHGYGYRNIGFILDRGYFSKKNLAYMDQNGYSFLIMVKGMKDFICGIIEENQGDFENSRGRYIDRYDVYGTTVKRFLCEGDTKKRNFHIYYSDGKAYSEKQEIKQRIRRLKKYLDSCVGKECVPFGPEIRKYFHLNYEKDGKTLKLAEENTSAVEKELSLAGSIQH